MSECAYHLKPGQQSLIVLFVSLYKREYVLIKTKTQLPKTANALAKAAFTATYFP